jgi:hypothetical protein
LFRIVADAEHRPFRDAEKGMAHVGHISQESPARKPRLGSRYSREAGCGGPCGAGMAPPPS